MLLPDGFFPPSVARVRSFGIASPLMKTVNVPDGVASAGDVKRRPERKGLAGRGFQVPWFGGVISGGVINTTEQNRIPSVHVVKRTCTTVVYEPRTVVIKWQTLN